MLRTIFVAAIVLYGAQYALRDAFGALLMYLWIAYFRPENWLWSADWLRSLNLSFIFGGFLLLRAPNSGANFKLDLRSTLLLTFLGLSFLSMLTSDYISYSWPWWVDFAKAIVITYLMTAFITDQEKFRMVILVIAVSLGFESMKQGWVSFIIHPGAVNRNALTELGDENEVALGLLMLVPVFFALAQTAVRRPERWIHWFFGLGVAYRAVTTYSRGGFLACGAMIIVIVLRSRHKVRSAIAVAVVAFVVASVMPQAFWDRMSTIKAPDAEEEVTDSSAASRLHFWRVATRMVAAHPLLGVGHNAYNAAYDKYDFLIGAYGHNRSVHSVWFGIMSEEGVPAFIVYLMILGLAVGGCQRVASRAKRGEVSADLGHFAIALQTSFAVVVVAGSFVPFQYKEMLWHFIGLSTALYALGTAKVPVAVAARPVSRSANPAFRPSQVIRGT